MYQKKKKNKIKSWTKILNCRTFTLNSVENLKHNQLGLPGWAPNKKKKKPNAKFLLPSICGKSLFSFFFLLFQWKIISLFFVQNASMLMLNYADFKIFFYHVIIAVFVLPSCKPLYNHIFKIPHKTTDRTIFRSDFDWARLCKTAWPSSWLWPEIIEKCPPLPLNPFYSTSPFLPLWSPQFILLHQTTRCPQYWYALIDFHAWSKVTIGLLIHIKILWRQ